MSEKDIKLLNLEINFPERYQITVDNDYVDVWDTAEEDTIGKFDSFGQEFIYKVLSHLGCNVQYA